MKKCKRCGHLALNEENICNNCHSSLNNRKEYVFICDKCGTKFNDEDIVCPDCNAKYSLMINQIENNTENITPTETLVIKNEKSSKTKILKLFKNKIILWSGIALIILVCGINFISDSEENKDLKEENVIQSVSVNKTTNRTTYENNSNLSFNNIQKLLKAKNIDGRILGVSAKNGNDGVVALYEIDDSYNFFVYDSSRDRTAIVPYLSVMGNILKQRSIKFEMNIDNDKENEDIASGSIWGNSHMIPIYAEYTVNNDEVVPGMLMTRIGEYGQYDTYLYSQANVEMVNIFLTKVNECITNAISNNRYLTDKLRTKNDIVSLKEDFKLAVVTGYDVFLRERPSTNSRIVTTLNKNTNVKVFGESKTITAKNNYILKADEYTDTDLSTDTPILLKKGIALKYVGRGNHGSESAICIIQVNGKDRKIEMRDGWRRNSRIVESIKDDIWFNVELNNGQKGWIYGKYINFM